MTVLTGDPKSVRGQVLSLIRDEGPMSRAELARRLELSATTITRVVNDLDAHNVLAEGQALSTSGAGRPGNTLHLRADSCYVAAVQIGVGLAQCGIFNALGESLATDRFTFDVALGPQVLLPINFARIRKGQVKVHAVLGHQLAAVPRTRHPDQVTSLEEEKVMAYYGAGTLYATPERSDPLL